MTTDLLTYGTGVVVVWFVAFGIRSVVARQWLYLIASWLFYFSWGSWLIGVLVFSSLMNYALGEWLKKSVTSARLWTGIILNLALLSIFKYLPLAGRIAPEGAPLSLLKQIVLPLGISFWTFQALSYLFELYREEELNPTLVEFCLYMAFWPTVLSGPICRMSAMLPQFRQEWSVGEEDLRVGMRRVAIGVVMSAIAGVMSAGLYAGAGIDAAFSNIGRRWTGIDVWCVIVAYAFQLYFNFCGYSHMVIGAARLFGIQLHENFNRPYLSTTPSVFWTRWHMSLSFWIRDFLFLPLATVRREVWWRNLSLVIAMFVFGVWHKGSFLFMIWGTYHGILLVLHRQWQEFRKRLGFEWSGILATGISWLLTFSGVCIGYIFFRANSGQQAWLMLKALSALRSYTKLRLDHSFYVMTFAAVAGYYIALAVGMILDRWSKAASGTRPSLLRRTFVVLAKDRWVWITPLAVVLTLYLSIVFHPGHAETGPVMYALF